LTFRDPCDLGATPTTGESHVEADGKKFF
jgi:hypothetical protein